jgi:RNA polymerase sigma factor (TIGR02999 family)
VTGVTQLLVDWGSGNEKALEALLPLVYDELRKRARALIRLENPGHTLDGTALVHEVYVKLVDQKQSSWQNRAQFYGLAAQVMRNILVDHARSRHRQKRGGEAVKLRLSNGLEVAEAKQDVDLIRLDDALHALEKLDAQQSRIVELRYFAGLTIEETAEALHSSPATIKRSWTTARLWLLRELSRN